jgi:prophage DNA circulation protein
MSWKEKLQKGSFRGIPFFTENYTTNGGRRTQTHEFVDRDTPYSEDLGRRARTFEISVHLIGDDIFQQRDALASALEQRGAGDLIHPYLGNLRVNVNGFSYTEDTGEGRIVRFTINFSEAGSNIYPSIEEDRQQTLLDFSENALGSAIDEFESGFSVAGQPGFVVDSAQALVANATKAFNDATKVFAETSDEITDLAFSIRNLQADTLDLIQAPRLLGQRLLDSIQLLSSVATNADDASGAYSTMFDFGTEPQQGEFETEARQREIDNTNAFNNYIRELAIISATQEAIDRNFFSVEEAIEEQEKLRDLLTRQSDREGTGINFFQNLQDLASSLVKAVPDVDNELPNLVKLVLQDTTNTLVLAYDLFEDQDREQEIIDRNKIRNPAFVIGGTELEVLNE